MDFNKNEKGILIPSYIAETKSDNITSSYQLMQYVHGTKPNRIDSNNFQALVQEGFLRSIVAGRCVELISESMASIKWQVVDKKTGEVIEDHPLLQLLEHPHPMMSRSAFFYQLQQFKTIGGTAYVRKMRANENSKEPAERLELLPPQNVHIVEGRKQWMPERYEYHPMREGKPVPFEVDQITGESDILRVYFPHPLDPFRGLSPMAKALSEILQINEGSDHNAALLKNSATPSGLLSMKDAMNEEEKTHLQKRVDDKFGGASNAGRPMVMSDGTWTTLGLTPKELDFVLSRKESNKLVAAAFGVPSILIGSDMEASTYSNMKEVRLNFTLDTILPQADLLATELTRFLCGDFDEDIEIAYDKNAIESLSAIRDEQFKLYNVVDVLTENERRVKNGWSELEETPEPEPEPEPAVDDDTDEEDEKQLTQVDIDIAVEQALIKAQEESTEQYRQAELDEIKQNISILSEEVKDKFGKEIEVKTIESKMLFDDEEGTIQFYGATFDKDKTGDIIRPHAFNRTLKNNKMPAFCWQHDIEQVVGKIVSAVPDEKGLLCTAKFAIKSSLGRDAYELYKSGSMDSFSIGYIVREKSYDRGKGIRYLDEIQLVEISCVTIPANDEAVVVDVKSENVQPNDVEV